MAFRFILLTSAAALVVSAAVSAQSPLEAMRACTAEKNDSARLACYDRAMANPSPPLPAASPAQPAPPATPAAVATDDFGMTEGLRRRRDPEQAKAEAAQALQARVVSVQKRQGGTLRVELDNGQVWVENEHKAELRIKEGDLVTIRSGLLGSYFLALESGIASRVKRVR